MPWLRKNLSHGQCQQCGRYPSKCKNLWRLVQYPQELPSKGTTSPLQSDEEFIEDLMRYFKKDVYEACVWNFDPGA